MGTHAHEQLTLLTDYDAHSAYTRAYHTLFTNMRFNWNSEQSRQQSILLAPPASYSGQAAVVANIAIAAVQNGVPTILVDADLHTPDLHNRFGLGKQQGLQDVLGLTSITHQTITPFLRETFLPGLSLLTAGESALPEQEQSRLLQANLHELMTSLQKHLAEIESRPALVLFHSSPVLANPTAALISSLVNQTFLIITSGQTTRTQARRAQEQLQRAHASLAGIIMVDV